MTTDQQIPRADTTSKSHHTALTAEAAAGDWDEDHSHHGGDTSDRDNRDSQPATGCELRCTRDKKGVGVGVDGKMKRGRQI